MKKNKIVVRYKDGNIIKGQTADFSPNKALFHIETINGEVKEVNMENLKAVFFVKDFEGNKQYKENYNKHIAGGGRKIKVQYQDDEEITGYTLGYSPERQGFFMIPADTGGNNERIFIVKSATKNIEFFK